MEDKKTGITPIYMRLAADYLKRGVGEYPCDNFQYDRVVVTQDKKWNNYSKEGNEEAYFTTFIVSFYIKDKKVKWFEFKSYLIGSGSKESNFNVL